MSSRMCELTSQSAQVSGSRLENLKRKNSRMNKPDTNDHPDKTNLHERVLPIGGQSKNAVETNALQALLEETVAPENANTPVDLDVTVAGEVIIRMTMDGKIGCF